MLKLCKRCRRLFGQLIKYLQVGAFLKSWRDRESSERPGKIYIWSWRKCEHHLLRWNYFDCPKRFQGDWDYHTLSNLQSVDSRLAVLKRLRVTVSQLCFRLSAPVIVYTALNKINYSIAINSNILRKRVYNQRLSTQLKEIVNGLHRVLYYIILFYQLALLYTLVVFSMYGG